MISKIEQIIKAYPARPLGQQHEYAVLLPLIKLQDETHILYEVRGQSISQPGDTSFPGGRIEAGERPIDAARRETMEELHVNADQINIFGAIDYIVRDWAIIYCFVGEILHFNPEEFEANDEVDHLFTVPLDFILANEPIYYNINIEERMSKDFPFERIHRGKDYKFHRNASQVPFYNLGLEPEEQLWGVTANLTHRFAQILLEQQDLLKGKPSQ
ncbi:NUDIX hydrolase [Ignavigranum ruoffiae]|uniref:NUDIX hydrolase n=1 Tax=Ignavigranum ruoffiae TaxID=89093 RepID=UPI0024AD4D88|nr:CoA pyrophosphatase [Ignavigranum ruoffiae]